MATTFIQLIMHHVRTVAWVSQEAVYTAIRTRSVPAAISFQTVYATVCLTEVPVIGRVFTSHYTDTCIGPAKSI